MLRLSYLQDYLYSPITQLFLKYFNDLCHKTYFNRNFGAVALIQYRLKLVLNWRRIGIELELIHTNYMVTTYLLYGKELPSSGFYLKLKVK